MPFEQIYHDSSLSGLDERQRDNIIFHRQAEVVIPDKIDLQSLQYVWCRSEAEYETLHYLLGDSLWEKWKEKITQRTDQSLFHRLWVYVDSVILGSKEIRFRFHPCNNSSDQGPFHLRLEIREKFTGLVYMWGKAGFVFDTNYLVLNLVNLEHPEWYVVTLTIDGHIAYANEYSELEDIPF